MAYSRVELYNSGREYTYFVCGNPSLGEIKDHPVTQSMSGSRFDSDYEITVKPFIYGKRLRNNLLPLYTITNRAEVERLLASCHNYLRVHDRLIILPEVTYKTDFAEGYKNANLLNSLIDRPGRSLLYSEVFMYGYGMDSKKLYFCGTPTFDDVKKYFEYETMNELYGERLTVLVTTYQYGSGEPLTPDEHKHLLTAPFIETLGEAHYYLQEHELSCEIGWKDLTRNADVNRGIDQTEREDEAEDGYEP